jgi:hypothetical protein
MQFGCFLRQNRFLFFPVKILRQELGDGNITFADELDFHIAELDLILQQCGEP